MTLINTIKESKRILILTHMYPDIDAICSGLSAINFIKKIYSGEVIFNIEGSIDSRLSRMFDLSLIQNNAIPDVMDEFKPDLILLVDTNNIKNASNSEEAELISVIKSKKIKVAIIDNHPEIQKGISDYYINNNLSSSSEELFNFFVNENKIPSDKQTSELVLNGLLADTNRFLYKVDNYEKTFDNVKTLIKSGAEIEKSWSKIYHFNINELKPISLLLKNLKTQSNYNYSYITDDEISELQKDGFSWEDVSNAYYMFVDLFLRYTGEAIWGFAILPEYNSSKYRVSLRSITDTFDTSAIARKFNGGGHKSASGCSLTAENHLDAIKQIQENIN